MKKLFILSVTAAAAVSAQGQTWSVGQWYQYSGNGNYYAVEAITGGTDGWFIAKSQAQALVGPSGGSGALASVTSLALDQFIFNGVNDPAYWTIDGAGNNEGPNLGGYQFDKLNEPAGDWAWVDGSTWSYTQWNPGEPNNSAGVEDYLTLFATGNNRSGNWNDIGGGSGPAGPGVIGYYIAESVPEPATTALLSLGGLCVLGLRRKK